MPRHSIHEGIYFSVVQFRNIYYQALKMHQINSIRLETVNAMTGINSVFSLHREYAKDVKNVLNFLYILNCSQL